MTLSDKIEYSVALIKKTEPLALRYCGEGFYLAFSGGKDSQVIHELTRMAGVRFRSHMSLTSIDPPQLVRFIRKHYPDVELLRPKESIYRLIERKSLPTCRHRWCCDKLKEQAGAGTVTILGVRREESVKRKKRNELEVSGRKYSGNFDQFSEHQETMIGCVKGKDKIMLSPILDWTEKDVWKFLSQRNLPHCELYDMGYKRIGCIMCPMSNKASIKRDREMFPGVEKAYKRAIGKYLEVHPGAFENLNRDPEMIFKWWVSKKSVKRFVADEITQTKIDFKN
jgi:phosphoadenosine phosphosulfate reductase